MADSPRPFAGLRRLPEFPGLTETWPYPAGSLNGNNGWTDVGGGPPDWQVAANHITLGSGFAFGTDAKDLSGLRFDPNQPFTVSFTLTSHATSTDAPSVFVSIGDPVSGDAVAFLYTSGITPTGIIDVAVQTPTQSFDDPAFVQANDSTHTWKFQRTATDLILFRDNVEVGRVTGAVVPPILPVITFDGNCPGATTLSVGTLQISQP